MIFDVINVTPREKKLATLRKFKPNVKDVDQIIYEESAIICDGKLIAIYKKINFDLNPVRKACVTLKFQMTERHNGIQTFTHTINASARNPRRNNLCQGTFLRKSYPVIHEKFLDCAKNIAKSYSRYFASEYANQVKRNFVGNKKVDEAYRIKGTPFTSGVINKNSALGYHRDSQNTKDGISCAIILKNGIAGGELILPELNIGFTCQDGYMLLFDGQKYIHGVTPIFFPQTSTGYRYTIVYYNNNGMSLCLPPEQEQRRHDEYLELQNEKRLKAAIDHEK